MIINKMTSPEPLVNSLVVLTTNSRPLKNIVTFNTETREATFSSGDPIVADLFFFETSSSSDYNSVIAAIEEAYPQIEVELPDGSTHYRYQEHDPRFLVSRKRAFRGKKGMDDSDNLPDESLVLSAGPLEARQAVCTNCSTQFLIHVSGDRKVWKALLANPGDTFQTMTEVDIDNLTCDNCSAAVAIYDPS